jgi:hypothetical protein
VEEEEGEQGEQDGEGRGVTRDPSFGGVEMVESRLVKSAALLGTIADLPSGDTRELFTV